MNDSRPLGVFDSGLGGLTVCAAIQEILPQESIVYFGDTARVPYGPKSAETIQAYSKQIASFLLTKNVKAIVVACNTASAFGIELLRSEFSLPIVGVIEPGVEAALATGAGRVGVIGTKGTIASQAYQKLLLKKSPDTFVKAQPTSMLVPLVEEGWAEGQVADAIIHEYLDGFVDDLDALILGCTHYPLLKGPIKRLFPELALIDSSVSVAHKLRSVLADFGIAAQLGAGGQSEFQFYVNDITQAFTKQVEIFFGHALNSVQRVGLE